MFSQKEFQNRVNKVISKMSELGLKALVILDTEASIGGSNIRYLTNFYNPTSPSVVGLVITPLGLTLCVNSGMQGSGLRLAQQTSWVKDVVGTRIGGSGGWGWDLAGDIRKTLAKAKIVDGKVGIDGLHLMTEPLAKNIRSVLSNFQLAERTGIVERLRIVKSQAEWELIREALRLTDVGMEAFMKAIKIGERVDLSISENEHAARVQGAESAFVYMGTGTPWVWGSHHGSQIFKNGDMVSAEANAKFQGYYGQIARSFVIGKSSEKQRHAYNAVLKAYQRMASMLKPGVRASEMFAAGNEMIKKAGLEPVPIRAGHGMGLTMAEGFDIYEGDDTEMQPEFYVMLHPFAPLEEGIVILGNCLRVTETGCEELTKLEFRLEI